MEDPMTFRPTGALRLTPLLTLLALPGLAQAATGEDIIEAMGLDLAAVSAVDVGDSAATMLDVRSDLGGILPRTGGQMGLLYTGDVTNLPSPDYPPADVLSWGGGEPDAPQPGCDPLWDLDYGDDGEPGDRASLSFQIEVPADAESFAFDSYFLSREYPEFVGSDFNDTFDVQLVSTAFTGQIVYDSGGNVVSVNNALFDTVFVPLDPADPDWSDASNPMLGTGFDVDGGTGWLTTRVPADAGDTIELTFSVADAADGICDSAVLLDFLRFDDTTIGQPQTGDGDDDDDSAGDDDDSAGDDDDSAVDDDDDSGDDDDSVAPAPERWFQGSGCSQAPTPGVGVGLAVLALGLFGLGLRRRRRSTLSLLLVAVIAAAATLLPPAPAAAQASGPSLDVQRFDPVAQSRGFTLVRDAAQPDGLEVGSFLAINYGLRPLEIGDPADYRRTEGVIDHLVGFDLGVSVAFNEWLQLGVQVPFLQIQGGSDEGDAIAAAFGHSGGVASAGDITLSAGIAPLRQGDNAPLSMSLSPRLVLPTGSGSQFVGSNAYGLGLDVAFSGRWKHFHVAGTVGFQVNTRGANLSNLRADDELRWGLGLGVPLLSDQLEIQLEWVGGTVIDPVALADVGRKAFDPVLTPAELNLGALVNPNAGPVWFKIGVGRGIGPGFGNPDLRVFGVVGFDVGCDCAPGGEPEVQIVEKMIEDPDPDRDEVKGDKDQCPHEPEDRDGFEDDDGCPEWDNDQDTVHDACDACPTTKEVLNGVDDADGCPDESLARIDVEKQEIVILDKIYFDLDKDTIKAASHPVLDAVFDVMSGYPQIERVEIQGHTDSRAPDDYNLDLSQRRADAAMRYLVDKGIDAGRLEAKGYGETLPLVPDAVAEEDHSKNRRVQFLILKVADGAPIIKTVEDAQPTAPEE
jgi:MYXO-CTERM domain-containing protein